MRIKTQIQNSVPPLPNRAIRCVLRWNTLLGRKAEVLQRSPQLPSSLGGKVEVPVCPAILPARGSLVLTLPTNRGSLAPGMELDAPLNSRESYSLGNRCQFVAITMRNILSLADASQQGNRALCSGKRSKGFPPSPQCALNTALALSHSPSLHYGPWTYYLWHLH